MYDALTASDSAYSKMKSLDTYSTYTESLDGDKITMSVKNEDESSDIEFNLDGDHITGTAPSGDYQAAMSFIYLCRAVGQYLGMDADDLDGYIRALGTKTLSKDYLSMEEDGDTVTYKVYVGGEYDLSEMDSWYIDSDVLGYVDELDDTNINNICGIGKVNMYSFGNKDSVDIYVAEKGDASELTYKSIIEIVNTLKPTGYEKFIDEFGELSAVDNDDYQVISPASGDDVPEVFGEFADSYVITKVHFGSKDSAEELEEYEDEYDESFDDEIFNFDDEEWDLNFSRLDTKAGVVF